MSLTRSPAERESHIKKARLAAFLGTTVEWYDFFIYSTAAALAFGPVFFPDQTAGTALLLSFATFWAGFLARPIGGIVFGHLGDKFGRKNTLVATLLIMGIATFCIGVLPGADTIGVWAPTLLVILRALQGFAVGGEWGGAVLLASESGSKSKVVRGGMFVQQGSPAGNILATAAFALAALLPADAFISWGWRLPFLFSAVLVIIGLVIRARLDESPEFIAQQTAREAIKVPIAELFKNHWKQVIAGVFASATGIGMAYFVSAFMLAYTTTSLGIDRGIMLNVLLINAIAQFLWQPIATRIAEKVGSAKFMAWSLAAQAILVVPMFLLVNTGSIVAIAAGIIASTVAGSGYYAVLAGFLAQAFPVEVRYTGVSFAYQASSTLIGGTTPLLAQSFLVSMGWQGVAGFNILLVAVTIAGVLALASLTGFTAAKERAQRQADE
ncbi:MAG: MFS transporter [Leucobacter sp.]|nr:MFS transporter [Leucobacter sp.]